MSNIVNGSTGVAENISHTHGEIIDFTIEDGGSTKIIKIYPVTKTSDSSVDILEEEDASTKYDHLITLLGLDAENDINTDVKLNTVLESLAEVGMKELTLDELKKFMDITNSDSLNDGDKIATAKAVYNAKINTKKEIMSNIILNRSAQTPEKKVSIYAPETDGEGVPYRNEKQGKWEWGKINSEDIDRWNITAGQILEGNQDFYFKNIPDLKAVKEIAYSTNCVYAIVTIYNTNNNSSHDEVIRYDNSFTSSVVCYKSKYSDLHDLQCDESYVYFLSTHEKNKYYSIPHNSYELVYHDIWERDFISSRNTHYILSLIKVGVSVAMVIADLSYSGTIITYNDSRTITFSSGVSSLYFAVLNGQETKRETLVPTLRTGVSGDIDLGDDNKSIHFISISNSVIWLNIGNGNLIEIEYSPDDDTGTDFFYDELANHNPDSYVDTQLLDLNTAYAIGRPNNDESTRCICLSAADDSGKRYIASFVLEEVDDIILDGVINSIISVTEDEYNQYLSEAYSPDGYKTIFFNSSLVLTMDNDYYSDKDAWINKFESININDYGFNSASTDTVYIFPYKSMNKKSLNVAMIYMNENELRIIDHRESDSYTSTVLSHNIVDFSRLYENFKIFDVNGTLLLTSDETSFYSSTNTYTTRNDVYKLCNEIISPYTSLFNKDIGRRIVVGTKTQQPFYTFTPDYILDVGNDSFSGLINRILSENSDVVEIYLLSGDYELKNGNIITCGNLKITGVGDSTQINLPAPGSGSNSPSFIFNNIEFSNIHFTSYGGGGTFSGISEALSLSDILSFNGNGKSDSNLRFNNCYFDVSFRYFGDTYFGDGNLFNITATKSTFDNCKVHISMTGTLSHTSVFYASRSSINFRNSEIEMNLLVKNKLPSSAPTGRSNLFLFTGSSNDAINFIDSNIYFMHNADTTEPVGMYLLRTIVDHNINGCTIYAYVHSGTSVDGSTFNSHMNNSKIILNEDFYTGEIDVSRNEFIYGTDSSRVILYGHTSAKENTFLNRSDSDISFSRDYSFSFIFKNNRVRVLPAVSTSISVIFDENMVFKATGNDILNPDKTGNTNMKNTVEIQYSSNT